MAKTPDRSTKVSRLRRQAEELLRATKRDVAAMPVKDVQQLVHELQVHQIELEMQNDELRRTQVELEAARDRYVNLYDFSPAGHLTLDTHGKIVEANLRAGTLLGVNREELIGRPLARFIAAKDEGTFHRHCQEVLKTGTRQTCEVHLWERAGVSQWVYFESLAVNDETGHNTYWRTALLDISDRKRAESQLEFQRRQREKIIGAMMDAIISVDETKRVVVFNRAAESMFLCRADDAIGQPLDRFIPERFRQAHQGHISAFAKRPGAGSPMGRPDTLFGLRANGEEFPFEASISHAEVDGRHHFTAILRDITVRKKEEDALRASQGFISAVLNSLSAHVCVLDRDGVILKTNDAWKVFAQQQADGIFTIGRVGHNYLALCRGTTAGSSPTGQAILKGFEGVLQGRDPIFSVEYHVQLPRAREEEEEEEEEEHWFMMRVTPLKGGKGVVILHTDISERVRMGQVLERHVLLLNDKQQELETLTGKLIEAQEEERRRIARELHDDFNQRLAALAVELGTIERAPVALPEPIARRLAAIRDQVGQLSDDLHDLAYNLHPSLLEHVGLEVAVREHIAEFTKRTGLSVALTTRKVPGGLNPELTTCLFRVMQESLQNVFKHAQATGLTLRLSGSSKGVGLSVRDDGKGFDMGSQFVQREGIGLMSMQERARLLGGFIRIHSHPGHGTKVCVWIPLSQEGA